MMKLGQAMIQRVRYSLGKMMRETGMGIIFIYRNG